MTSTETPYPLGRVQEHDPRSLNFLVATPRKVTPVSRSWRRYTPILDQGQVSSCTGNATTGLLGTAPLYGKLYAQRAAGLVLDEPLAVKLYSRATVLDAFPGTYPPDDTGSSGLAAAKAARENGLISAYHWITSIDAAHAAIATGPFMVGVDWYESFFHPDAKGEIRISGSVAGGHEFEILGYSAKWNHWKAANSWGTNWGVNGYFYLNNDTLSSLLHAGGDATVLS